jgi:Flp pilus assembly protein TadD
VTESADATPPADEVLGGETDSGPPDPQDTPTESAPTESAPVESAPAKSEPAESAPSESAPTEDSSTPLLVALVAAGLLAVLGYGFFRAPTDKGAPSGDATELLAEGRRIGKSQDLADAIPYFEKAAALAPDDPEVHAVLGRSLTLLRKPEAAIPVLKRACELDPQRAETQQLLGVCLTAIGDFKGARTALQEALRLAPDDPEPYYYLGVGAEALDEPKAATAAFLTYSQRSKNGRRVVLSLRKLAAAQIALNDGTGSVASLQSLVAIVPGDVSAQRTLEGLLLRRDGYEARKEAATAAAAAKGAHPIRHFLLAELLAQHPAYQEASREAYAVAVRTAPRALPAHVRRVRQAVRAERLAEAQEYLEAVPKELSGHPEVVLAGAEVDRLSDRHGAARAGFARLLQQQQRLSPSTVADAQLGTLGSLLDEGRDEEAMSYVRSLFAFAEPGDPRHQLEAETLQRLGRFAEADQIFRRLIAQGRKQDRVLWDGLRTYLLLEANKLPEARKLFAGLVATAKEAKLPPPPELALWAGVAFLSTDPERAKLLWEAGAGGPRYGDSCWRTMACERLLGRGDAKLLQSAARIAGWDVANDADYLEGLSLSRRGETSAAKAVWKRGLERTRGKEFPARLIERALGK